MGQDIRPRKVIVQFFVLFRYGRAEQPVCEQKSAVILYLLQGFPTRAEIICSINGLRSLRVSE